MSAYTDMIEQDELYGPDTPHPSEYGPGGLLENLQLRCFLTPICESPIEIDLGAALIQNCGGRYEIVPQHKAGRFRYDFGVFASGKLAALVECDGAEFHSTPEQIANDGVKDALAAKLGVTMFRFAGRMIYRSPCAVALSIIHNLDSRGRS